MSTQGSGGPDQSAVVRGLERGGREAGDTQACSHLGQSVS